MATKRKWTDEELIEAVKINRGYAGVLRALGLVAAGGNYHHIKQHIAALSLDTSHFTYQGWNKGLRYSYRPINELLVAGRLTSSDGLKRRLWNCGLKPMHCEKCGWCEHTEDGRLPLELDHINGDHLDNRIENLRILCPNCHSLTPTHRGRNQKRARGGI